MAGVDPADPLATIASWGHPATAAWTGPTGSGSAGDTARVFPWASVTKLITAMAVWIGVEEGTVAWDDEIGPPGATLRHLLSHASGLAPDTDTAIARPGTRRIYSNRGIETAAEHVAHQAGMPFFEYATEAVVGPLGMTSTVLPGSPAHSARGPLADLCRLTAELAQPTLVDESTWQAATSVAFPGLAGVLPGFGSQPDNAWGLGPEIRAHKSPHWTGAANAPETYGHFGQSGSLLWVDPVAGVTLCSLSERPFGPWAAEAWPKLSDAVLAHARRGG